MSFFPKMNGDAMMDEGVKFESLLRMSFFPKMNGCAMMDEGVKFW